MKESNIKRVWRGNLWLRYAVYLFGFALLWQLVALSGRFPRLMFPSLGAIVRSLFEELLDGSMFQKTGYSLLLIVIGMGVSLLIALLLTVLSMLSRTAKDIVKMLISMMDPLPGIALQPLCILWFGVGNEAILFVMVHSIVWPIVLSALNGFDSVPAIYRDVGRSFGLSKLRMVGLIFTPAAFASILTGLKTGWARAWRALLSAEMVFGTMGAMGGLGWDMYIKRGFLDVPGMFATLIMVMAIGILVEQLLFNTIERRTLRKWGMVG